MAILEGLPGFTVNVCVDGKPAEEYPPLYNQGDEISEERTTYCCRYIESKSGQRFGIQCNIVDATQYNDYEAFCFDVHIDGHYADGQLFACPTDACYNFIDGIQQFDSELQHWVLRPFCFAAISVEESGDKERITRDSGIAASLGTIRVNVYTCHVLGLGSSHDPIRELEPGSCFDRSHLSLAEKATKGRALSHATSLGEKEDCAEVDRYDIDKMVKIGEYVFKYRSRSALQAKLVIPRSPTPAPPEVDYHGMSREELIAILSQRDERAVKQETNETPCDLSGQIFPTSTTGNGTEVVDLT